MLKSRVHFTLKKRQKSSTLSNIFWGKLPQSQGATHDSDSMKKVGPLQFLVIFVLDINDKTETTNFLEYNI